MTTMIRFTVIPIARRQLGSRWARYTRSYRRLERIFGRFGIWYWGLEDGGYCLDVCVFVWGDLLDLIKLLLISLS
jgi:hypothetical protein